MALEIPNTGPDTEAGLRAEASRKRHLQEIATTSGLSLAELKQLKFHKDPKAEVGNPANLGTIEGTLYGNGTKIVARKSFEDNAISFDITIGTGQKPAGYM